MIEHNRGAVCDLPPHYNSPDRIIGYRCSSPEESHLCAAALDALSCSGGDQRHSQASEVRPEAVGRRHRMAAMGSGHMPLAHQRLPHNFPVCPLSHTNRPCRRRTRTHKAKHHWPGDPSNPLSFAGAGRDYRLREHLGEPADTT